MKRLSFLFTLALVIAIFLTQSACEPQGTKTNGPVLLGSFYAIVEGNEFTADNGSGSLADGKLSVSAQRKPDSAGTAIILFEIADYSGAKEYPIGGKTTATYTEYGVKYTATWGKISVTSAGDAFVSGTLSFTAERQGVFRKVSAGLFQMSK